MKLSRLRALRSIVYDTQSPCVRCQLRLFTTTQAHRQPGNKARPVAANDKLAPTARQVAPEKLRKDFVIRPIGAPIGFPSPPNPLEDWAKLERFGTTAKERNEANRKILWKKLGKSYFRDIRNMDVNRGKFYLANEKLYKKEAALYFPNLNGMTLANKGTSNTTRVLKDKVTVVTLFQKAWAEQQIQSWIGDPKDYQSSHVLQTIASSGGEAQLVEINHEQSKMISMFFPIFRYTIARTRPAEQHNKYFLLGSGGLPQTVKDTIALMNERIGYVFLVDRNFKIRWSGCGDATDAERESLVTGLKKVMAEKKA